MFAYVKQGNVIAVSESRLQKFEPSEFVSDDLGEYWTDEVPGLIFDDEIETELEGELELVEGELHQKETPSDIVSELITE